MMNKGLSLWVILLLLLPLALLAQEREVDLAVGLLDIEPIGGADREESQEYMALRRIMEIQGIPYVGIQDWDTLRNYKVIFTAGALNNTSLDGEAVNRLYDYVELGGTLFAAGEVGSRMFPLFGVSSHGPSRSRYRLSFIGQEEIFHYLDLTEERTISLGNGEAHFYDQVIWSHGYEPLPGCRVLGRYEEGDAGFLVNSYGRGRAYLLGLSYRDSVLLPQTQADYEAQRNYVNSVEPSADVVMLILKAVYQEVNPLTVVKSVIPQARSCALLLSHDVDAQTAFADSLKFARLEEEYGVTSTFYVNTKIYTDEMDIAYYNIPENREVMIDLYERGWDMASHSLSHYLDFAQSPPGEEDVTIENYNPLSLVTINGEVRVSKALLDRDFPNLETVNFRAGHLETPPELIDVLEEAGYLYDSSFAANDNLTAFPYFALTMDRSRESSVIEMPVTLDDALGFLIPSTVDRAVERWIYVNDAHGDNRGITVLLIHPSDTRDEDYKLRAQDRLMGHVASRDGWMGNMTEYAIFWRARHSTEFQLYRSVSEGYILQLNRPLEELHPWLGLELQGRLPQGLTVRDSRGQVLDIQVRRDDRTIYVSLEGMERTGRFP